MDSSLVSCFRSPKFGARPEAAVSYFLIDYNQKRFIAYFFLDAFMAICTEAL